MFSWVEYLERISDNSPSRGPYFNIYAGICQNGQNVRSSLPLTYDTRLGRISAYKIHCLIAQSKFCAIF